MRSYKNKKRKERLSHIEDSMIGWWFFGTQGTVAKKRDTYITTSGG